MSDKQLLACDNIIEKKLFFSGELKEQLSLLSNSLNEEHYKNLCERLEEKQLPKGIAALFYGEPGTGKTESVMQIARATGRDIMHVDISATKKMCIRDRWNIIIFCKDTTLAFVSTGMSMPEDMEMGMVLIYFHQ